MVQERIIGFSLGLSADDIEKGKNSFSGFHPDGPALAVIALGPSMLRMKVSDAMVSVMADIAANRPEEPAGDINALSADACPYRVVIVFAQEREQVLQVMRSFKAVLPDPQNIIFAVITQTALNWTFEDYIGHLNAEHEQMKTRQSR